MAQHQLPPKQANFNNKFLLEFLKNFFEQEKNESPDSKELIAMLEWKLMAAFRLAKGNSTDSRSKSSVVEHELGRFGNRRTAPNQSRYVSENESDQLTPPPSPKAAKSSESFENYDSQSDEYAFETAYQPVAKRTATDRPLTTTIELSKPSKRYLNSTEPFHSFKRPTNVLDFRKLTEDDLLLGKPGFIKGRILPAKNPALAAILKQNKKYQNVYKTNSFETNDGITWSTNQRLLNVPAASYKPRTILKQRHQETKSAPRRQFAPEPKFVSPNYNKTKHWFIKSLQCTFMRCFTRDGVLNTMPCELSFSNSETLRNHLYFTHKIKTNRCLIIGCKKSYNGTHRLGNHLKNDHAEIKKFECSQCKKWFYKYEILQKHMFRLHWKGQFRCTIADCSFTGITRGETLNHCISHRIKTYERIMATTYLDLNDFRMRRKVAKIAVCLKERGLYLCTSMECDKELDSEQKFYVHVRKHSECRS